MTVLRRGTLRTSVSLVAVPLLLVSVVPALSALPRSSAETTTTVSAAEDTYARSDAPDEAHGSEPRWSVDGRRGVRRHGFIKFHLPAGTGATYPHATLRVFTESALPTGPGPDVFTTSNGWSEERLTWAGEPGRGTRLATAGTFTAGSWVSFDVSAAVRPSGRTVSFRLETRGKEWMGFEARESQADHAPELVLQTVNTPGSGRTSDLLPPAVSVTAAQKYRWGHPVGRDEFSYQGAPDPARWNAYTSRGHAGKGLRRRTAWQVANGRARVTGDPSGVTGGMSASFGRQKYGRWEARMRTNARDPEYHPVLVLWPDSGKWPCDGEIDYAEGTHAVGRMNMFHHYSCKNRQTSASRPVDTTQWHNYAVEWTPSAIVGYLDGREWFRDTDRSHQPPGPMHQSVQLDWFPDDSKTSTSWMEVDWVRAYSLRGAAPPPPPLSPSGLTPSDKSVKLAVLGDVNHDGNSVRRSREGKLARSIKAWDPDAVALTGDLQYDFGSCDHLVHQFDATGWGDLMPRTILSSGATHDYTATVSSASDYSRHAEGTCPGQKSGATLSARQWDRTIEPYEPHYVDLGAWTIVSMPSAQWRNDYAAAYGPEWTGTALTAWLETTVAAARGRGDEVVVQGHEPFWASGTEEHGESHGDDQRPWIDVLDRYNVRLLLSGHQHSYERFHPQRASSKRDDPNGTQQFQVSTGGIGLRKFTTEAPNSASRTDSTFGWLALVLHPDGSYDWRFVATEGRPFTDVGHRRAQ
jgi:hypothetical protein